MKIELHRINNVRLIKSEINFIELDIKIQEIKLNEKKLKYQELLKEHHAIMMFIHRGKN